MSKSKFYKRTFRILKYLNSKTKGHCLMICQTRVLFWGHPVHGSTNDALVVRPNLLPAPPSPQNGVATLSFSCRDNVYYLSMPCASGIQLPIGFNKIIIKCMIFIIIKMDLLDISRIKSNKLQTAIKISANNQ